jgi:putative membrane-bound dehydrogenase-like protein
MKSKRVLLLGAAIAGGLFAAMQSSEAQLSPEKSLETFHMADGFQAAAWASEPGLVNPTDIDIDERGRVWALEAANYRKSQIRPEGDRILILEDTHHTGHCDSYKVFVQDKRLNAPLGICKLGNKLYVSQSPNVFVYTIDEATDKPAGEPQVFFTGFEGVNHDHGVHAFVFGPDGRLYFNCGNEGGKGFIKHGDGTPVIDITGSEVGEGGRIYKGKPKTRDYSGPRQGLVLSCDLDGSNFQTYAYNFRNNYELCVDSFGTVWQSDNDDDGNQGCCINYVMEGGDFGYTGPRGSNWGRDRGAFPGQTKQEAHWHQRWPGVVPNMLNTGQGAPCGILVYEGSLFGDRYVGALFHADAGPNVVRAYITTPSEHVAKGIMNNDPGESMHQKAGAGYQCDSVEIMKSSDHWARPDDVCVAPDGSIFMSDWYDPGVGGHATGDIGAKLHDWHKLNGRVFRFYPEGKPPETPKLDLATVPGQIAALESPNQARRYLAYQKLDAGGAAAETALQDAFEHDRNPRFRARALWLLARGADGKATVARALKDKDPDIRVTAIRAARRTKMDMVQVAHQMLADTSPAVLRELCLAMQFEPDERAIPVLVKLADKYDGTDRWYLEAFGIGARDREAKVLSAWTPGHQNKDAQAERGIEWRLKMEPTPLDGKATPPLTSRQLVTGWWAVGPFPSSGAASLDHNFGPDASAAAIDPSASFAGVGGKTIRWEQVHTTDGGPDAPQWVDFKKFCTDRHFPSDNVVGYFATTIVAPQDEAAQLLVGSDDATKIWLNGAVVLNGDTTRPVRLGDDEVNVTLHKGMNVLLCKLRQGNGDSGITVALKTPGPITFATGAHASAGPAAQGTPSAAPTEAGTFLMRDGRTLLPMAQLASLSGDARAGEAVFRNANGANCIRCHQLGDQGGIIGPPLNQVGQKLNKAQLYEAILYPSAAIEMGYETWVVKAKDGQVFTGRKVEDTDDHVTILDADGKYHDIPLDKVERKVQQKISLMPDGLVQAMTQSDLVNLVEFLSRRK